MNLAPGGPTRANLVPDPTHLPDHYHTPLRLSLLLLLAIPSHPVPSLDFLLFLLLQLHSVQFSCTLPSNPNLALHRPPTPTRTRTRTPHAKYRTRQSEKRSRRSQDSKIEIMILNSKSSHPRFTATAAPSLD
ncbi:hypothetical protein B0H13DRAFT_2324815 [Mycena leptocephala]|nr:hypothetical protein B0H13DRAFT_2324815 [Mycena leptocephala]